MYQNNKEAFCLAVTYNLLPRRNLPYIGTHNYDTGMFEPDHTPEKELRCMVIAHIIDATNILVKYNPELNFAVTFHVDTSVTPDIHGNYSPDTGWNDRPTYYNAEKEFYIWWDDIDSWIINEQPGHTDGPYFKRTGATIPGTFSPFGGAVGSPIVLVGPE